jgi:hypothetical protein
LALGFGVFGGGDMGFFFQIFCVWKFWELNTNFSAGFFFLGVGGFGLGLVEIELTNLGFRGFGVLEGSI